MYPAGTSTRALHVESIAGKRAEESFGHLRAGRVVRAKEEHALHSASMMRGAGTRRRRASAALLDRVDDDAAPAQRGGWVCAIRGVQLVVVHQLISVVLVPDLDAELVLAASPVDLSIDGGDHETVVPGPVDRPRTLVLRFR